MVITKRGLLAALILIAGAGPASAFFERATEEDKTVQVIHEVPGVSRDNIYASTKLWIAENFRSAKQVIDHEVPADGLLIAKGSIPYPCSGFECVAKGTWLVSFTMRMDVKDQRFRLQFTNILVLMPEESTPWQKSVYEEIRPKLLAIGEGIKAAAASPKKKEDW